MSTVKEIVEYVINLGGDVAERAEKTTSNLTSLRGAASAGITVLGGLSTAALSAAASYKVLADHVFGVVDQVGDLAAGAGLSTDVVNGLRLAARATSGELEELVPVKLAEKIVEAAEGGKTATAAFDRLGISVLDASGNLASADDVFRTALERILAIEDPTIRAAAAVDVFGKQGRALLGTFEDIDAFDRFIDGAREFGLDTGPAAAAAAGDWYNSMNTLATSVEHVQQTLLENTGGVTQWVEAFSLGLVYIVDLVSGFGTVLLDVRDKVLANAKEIFQGIQDAIAGNPIEVNVTTREDLQELVGAGIDMVLLNARANAQAFWEDFIQEGAPGAGAGGGGGGGGGSGLNLKPGFSSAATVDARGGGDIHGAMFLTATEYGELAQVASVSVRELTGWTEKLPAVAYEVENFGTKVRDAAGGLAAGAAKGAIGAADAIGALQGGLSGVGMAIAGPVGAAVGTVMQDLDEVPDLLRGIGGSVVAFANQLPEVLPEIVTVLVAELPAALVQAGVEIVTMILDPGFWLDLLKTFATALLEGLKRIFEDIFGFKGEGKDVERALARSAPGGTAGVFGDTADAILGARGDRKIAGLKIPFFDEGTPRITRTGLAVVHKGEEIRTAAEVANAPGGGRTLVVNFNGPVAGERELARMLRRAQGTHGWNDDLDPLVT